MSTFQGCTSYLKHGMKTEPSDSSSAAPFWQASSGGGRSRYVISELGTRATGGTDYGVVEQCDPNNIHSYIVRKRNVVAYALRGSPRTLSSPLSPMKADECHIVLGEHQNIVFPQPFLSLDFAQACDFPSDKNPHMIDASSVSCMSSHPSLL